MNPTLNKKDFDDLATNLKDLAFSYIEKYSPVSYTHLTLPTKASV